MGKCLYNPGYSSRRHATWVSAFTTKPCYRTNEEYTKDTNLCSLNKLHFFCINNKSVKFFNLFPSIKAVSFSSISLKMSISNGCIKVIAFFLYLLSFSDLWYILFLHFPCNQNRTVHYLSEGMTGYKIQRLMFMSYSIYIIDYLSHFRNLLYPFLFWHAPINRIS